MSETGVFILFAFVAIFATGFLIYRLIVNKRYWAKKFQREFNVSNTRSRKFCNVLGERTFLFQQKW